VPPRIKIAKLAGELRRSQIINSYGCGALGDFPRISGIMSGQNFWHINLLNEELKIHEKDLELYLGKEFFVQVSSPKDAGDLNKAFTIPIFRFPRFYYCPECHVLDDYKYIGISPNGSQKKTNSQLKCNSCGAKLIPSRFIAACPNGHIEDFPYVWWAHRNKGKCDNPQLMLEYKGNTGGLDAITISCTTCHATTTMEDCMRKDALAGSKCFGKMPWLGEGYQDPEHCSASLRVLQRSANNVYYPVKMSALTIPPWSNVAQEAINKHYTAIDMIFSQLPQFWDMFLASAYKSMNIHEEYGCDEDVFIKEAKKRFANIEVNSEITEDWFIINEYKAFCGSDVDDPYFKTVKTTIPIKFSEYFDEIKLVKRLREIQVLRGFRRIVPEREADEEERIKQGIMNRAFAPISDKNEKWLPAVELLGEGIFFRINEKKLEQWEQQNCSRYNKMTGKVDEFHSKYTTFSPRYVLLHTLAHLIIRQLTLLCGYETASLKEKIYSTHKGIDEKMAGILIYTASSDSDGSLGGLVREGEAKRIEKILLAMLQEASWCSNDPICIESKSQGYKSLNYAACHACAMLPETSCEAGNSFLDRAAVVGLPEDKELAFFYEFVR